MTNYKLLIFLIVGLLVATQSGLAVDFLPSSLNVSYYDSEALYFNSMFVANYLPDGINVSLQLRVNGQLNTYYPTSQDTALFFSPLRNATIEEGTTISFTCINPITLEPVDGTLPLSSFLVLNSTHAIIRFVDMPMFAGNWYQWIYEGNDSEASSITLSQSCAFRADGQSLFMFSGVFYKYGTSIDSLFSIPTEATNGLVTNIHDSMDAVFDVIKLVLIAIGLILLLFIIIFTYKLLVYFVRWVKGNQGGEQQ